MLRSDMIPRISKNRCRTAPVVRTLELRSLPSVTGLVGEGGPAVRVCTVSRRMRGVRLRAADCTRGVANGSPGGTPPCRCTDTWDPGVYYQEGRPTTIAVSLRER